MFDKHWLGALAAMLVTTAAAQAQVVSGVMTVTGAEMH